jgi:Flp pilus assembly protein TadD
MYSDEGNYHFRRGEYEKAHDLLWYACGHDPSNSEACTNWGIAKDKIEERKNAAVWSSPSRLAEGIRKWLFGSED